MKVINRTHYVTADLRAILSRVANEELEVEKRKRARVEVRYCRTRGGCSGEVPYLKANVCVVRINKHDPDPAMFASVAAHEYAHMRGMSHQNMPTRYKWGSPTWKERYAWADELGVRVVAKKAKASTDEKRAAKLEHAKRMYARSITRLKRANTLAKKWKAKLARLEKPVVRVEREKKPRAPKPVDPRLRLRMRHGSAVGGEFHSLIVDLSRDMAATEPDRGALYEGLHYMKSGWIVDEAVLDTLRAELKAWNGINEYAKFDRLIAAVDERLRLRKKAAQTPE